MRKRATCSPGRSWPCSACEAMHATKSSRVSYAPSVNGGACAQGVGEIPGGNAGRADRTCRSLLAEMNDLANAGRLDLPHQPEAANSANGDREMGSQALYGKKESRP